MRFRGQGAARPLPARIRFRRGLGALAAFMVSALAVGIPAVRAQRIEGVRRELTSIEGDIDTLLRNRVEAVRRESPTHVEERLADGELHFQLRDYLRASIIFTDIVERHREHPAFADALFLLGESLFLAGDYLGARTRFREVINDADQTRMRPHVQRSLGRLIEIAIHTRDFDGVEDYFARLSRLPPTEVEANTAYFRAKYLYSRAVMFEHEGGAEETVEVRGPQLEEARTGFEAVARGSAYYPQARYFIGVIHTLRDEFPQAIEAFRRVLQVEAETPEQRSVVELAQLALGRLYYETEQLLQAIEAYQAVPRTSTHFDQALYEIAWVFIRLGDSVRAERALEVLGVASPDSHLIPDGKLLRANLLLRNGRFDEANTVFAEIRDEFRPIQRDLDAIIRDRPNPAAYFRSLVRENMNDFDINQFLPESARNWIELEGEYNRALTVLGDLSEARSLVEETDGIIHRLEGALEAENRVNIFGDLREQRRNTTVLRNRLHALRRQIVAIEERTAPGGGPEVEAIRERRRAIEDELGSAPTSAEGVESRDLAAARYFRDMMRTLRELEVEVLGLEARIVATERFLETAPGDGIDRASVQSELDRQREQVEYYQEQIRVLRRQVDVARIHGGTADELYARERELRAEYLRLVAREREMTGRTGTETDQLYQRTLALEARLDERDRDINTAVERRIAIIRETVEEERVNLDGYRAALASLEGETEDVVGAITYANFRRIRGRFYDLVLRAEVGRVDVAWARREEHRQRVILLTTERNREIQALDDEFRDIMDEDEAGAEEDEEDAF